MRAVLRDLEYSEDTRPFAQVRTFRLGPFNKGGLIGPSSHIQILLRIGLTSSSNFVISLEHYRRGLSHSPGAWQKPVPQHKHHCETESMQAGAICSLKVRKRSYARAIRRFDKYGGAWCKRRRIGTGLRFPHITRCPSTVARRRPGTGIPTTSAAKRYDLLTWNTAGLDGGLSDELLLYIKQRLITHPLHKCQRSQPSPKILTMISKRIVYNGSLTYIAANNGRVVPTRSAPDGCHQLLPTHMASHCSHSDRLIHQVHAAPLHSRLLIGSDCNTPCTQTP